MASAPRTPAGCAPRALTRRAPAALGYRTKQTLPRRACRRAASRPRSRRRPWSQTRGRRTRCTRQGTSWAGTPVHAQLARQLVARVLPDHAACILGAAHQADRRGERVVGDEHADGVGVARLGGAALLQLQRHVAGGAQAACAAAVVAAQLLARCAALSHREVAVHDGGDAVSVRDAQVDGVEPRRRGRRKPARLQAGECVVGLPADAGPGRPHARLDAEADVALLFVKRDDATVARNRGRRAAGAALVDLADVHDRRRVASQRDAWRRVVHHVGPRQLQSAAAAARERLRHVARRRAVQAVGLDVDALELADRALDKDEAVLGLGDVAGKVLHVVRHN
eukprot:162239-Chlamydomonas_euryale.AAC.1